MERRKFLTGAALGGAALAAGCDCADKCGVTSGPNIVRQRRELKMVTTWPKDFPGLGTAAEETARAITEMTDGEITIQVYGANELVGAFEVFDAVANGAADLYHGAEYYWVGKAKAYPFFTAVPFGMTLNEIMGWVEFGGGQQLWDELSAGFNIKPFHAGNTGHQMGGWFKREINSLEDLRGLKIRMPGLGGEVMRRVGAAAVAIPGGEIYQALQSGSIDASEWVGPFNDLAFGFHREARYYYWPGFHEPAAALGVGINLDLWNSLTPSERKIFQTACQAANNQSIAQFAHFNGIALKTLIEEHDVQMRRMPDDVLAELARQSRIVLEEVAETDDISRRIYESYRASMKATMEWNGVSDEAYMAARRRVHDL